MQSLTYVIGKDKRNLVDDIQNFKIDFNGSNYNWVQARQYEDGMRQVFVTMKNEDGSPFDLTGCNYWFEGILPDGVHKILDAKHGVAIDPLNGQFRFDMPKQAFAVAGSYVQAFFRIVRDGNSVTTLEFDLEVLADKVISGLVPSDYITPFEDLYGKLKDYITKSNGDFDAAMTQWKKDVANLITELNADISGINLTISEIKTQLASLEEKIKADGLLTQAEFDTQIKIVNQNIADALEKLKGNIIVGDNITIGKQVNKSNQSAIDNLKSLVNPTLFNFVFITDVHYDKWSDANKTGLDRLNHALDLDGSVDAIISGGDNIDGGALLPEIFDSQTREYVNDQLFMHNNGSDKFILKGNHDDASGRLMIYYNSGILAEDGTIPTPTKSEKLHKMYGNNLLINNEIRNGMSNYFYKDYPNKKIRLIGLDSNDIPDDIMNADNRPKYYGIKHMGYQQTQLNWLANTALQNVPNDYTTVIVAHVHADASTPDGTADDNKNDMYYNVNLMVKIVNDFKNGRSSNVIGTIKDWEVSIKTDFTSQGPRNLAGFVHGHRHLELFNNGIGFNNIGITCSIDKDQVDAWDVITIDTTNKKMVLKGFGRATNREYNY